VIYRKLHHTGLWVKKNPKEASILLSKAWGIDAPIIEESINHRSYRVAPVTIAGLSEQQKIADAFTAEKLLPRKIDTANVTIWAPQLKEVGTGH
jgi:sulfonate transport system substrate-binding protein